ncbi:MULTISPECIES: RNA polymerase factor sigma-54 [Brevibacillus]|uniref:RNA polymerase factor sigma-54 n=1 Tax=Brevibacillus TaxID=55080 RepID=UPI000D10986C|nr:MULTISPECIES: RNA polymerase factor sigma-54 [Brevibacillus]PSJ66938.1 RNA polymerase sigma-54 factor [Brevibacillus brevis]RED27787.1 RNA polymerase RpoN-/SigL-like sigma 54 subunit [Brevibacillus brevis]TQK53991.1 RNA polymerase RpoN-/SigL-like sigma 54 subunit [Brevibacillus sp. AG162]VEF86825.1 RNA polymerase factor sigma-54 [Brevibacillus brevis]GEC88627.1 RNA polymerase sigma-54 factor [Brevibacillus brevis]
MNMGLGLFQEQTLKLVMTPELRQAITILQYSAIDLISYLQDQANENPVFDLEVAGEVASAKAEKPAPEIDWKEIVGNRATGEYGSSKNESTYNPLDHVQQGAETLYEHLERQLGYVKGFSSLQKQIALFLIGNLDEKGYLEITLEEASARLGAEMLEIEDVLSVLQHFDPVGVASRSLEECLLLQLGHLALDDEKIVQVVRNHLQDLADNRYQRIADKIGCTPQEVQAMADLIRTLNPRPGAAFSTVETRYVIPDVTVEKVGNDYVVLVNDVAAPRLKINSFYEKMLSQQKSQDEAKQFIHDKLNAAMWLAKSLEQRRLTLMRVTQAILDMQREFFDRGIHYLKPMTQKEIAERVGLHESTISRATSNKYVQTPRGIFELKYFFTSALSTSSGEATSSESVKRRIKALIEQEDRKSPLSDQKLGEMLLTEGIEISRRTVAKYREEMLIPSSAKRKRF